MPKPAIVRGSDQHYSFTYEGNGTGQTVGKFVPFTDNATIGQSCLFDDGSEPKLARTPSSAGNSDTFTWSSWVKRAGNMGSLQVIFQHGADINNCTQLSFDSSNRLGYQHVDGGGNTDSLVTNRTFADRGVWYHIVLRVDTTQSTEANRVRFYVNGEQIYSFSTANYPSQNTDTDMNTTNVFNIGEQISSTKYSFDGYFAEVNYVDGTSYGPDTFGITDTSTGKWIPKTLDSVSYGTNGFRFTFANSAGQTIGDDTSGNGNDFAVTNINAADIMKDSPTSSFTTMCGDDTGSFTIDQGGLNITSPGSGQYEQIIGCQNFGVSTGKWYWEMRVYNKGKTGVGWKSDSNVGGGAAADTGGSIGTVYNVGSSGGFADGEWTDDYSNAYSNFSTFTAASAGDIVMFAIDLDNRKGYVGLNGTWFNSANPANGTGSIGLGGTITTNHAIGAKFYPMMLRLDSAGQNNFNFGQNPTFSNAYAPSFAANTATSGPGLFKYTPPTDFLAINSDNLPTTNKGRPALSWTKNIDRSSLAIITDSVMGPVSSGNADFADAIFPSSTGARALQTGGKRAPTAGGFRVISGGTAINAQSETHCSWNWVGNNGTRTANADGSGATTASTIEVNDTAGFSVVHYNGAGTSDKKIAHGLSQTPETIWLKNIVENSSTGSGVSWRVYHHKVYNVTSDRNSYLRFDSDDSHTAVGDTFGDTAPTNKVFTVGNDVHSNASVSGGTAQYMAYCWYGIDGFSKFGSYTGNGDADGPFIVTGFKPAYLLIKGITVGNNWILWDNTRTPVNECDNVYYPDLQQANATSGNDMDLLSNGFKIRGTNSNYNGDYIYAYWAFAEHPFIGDGTNPCPAR